MTLPTSFHPALTGDRLTAMALVIVNARRGALALHDPEAGETNLSLGVRTRERACQLFRELKNEVDWLNIVEDGYYMLLLLGPGLLPIKFHRGDPDAPPTRTVKERETESALKQGAFAFYQQPVTSEDAEHVWRLLFQDDPETREVFSVTLARARTTGEVDNSWPIEISESVTSDRPPPDALPEAAELESPTVAPLPAAVPKMRDEL